MLHPTRGLNWLMKQRTVHDQRPSGNSGRMCFGWRDNDGQDLWVRGQRWTASGTKPATQAWTGTCCDLCNSKYIRPTHLL